MGTVPGTPGEAVRDIDDGNNGSPNLRRDFEALKADFASMRDHLRTVLGDVRHGVSDRAGDVVGRAGEAVGKATGTLKEHPIALMTAAFCAGIAFGALLLRR